MINKNSSQIKTLLLEGISLLNSGEFFEAHEILEAAWHLEKSPIRTLYQGLIQLSVACYHAKRKNWIGARRVLGRARDNVIPFVSIESIIVVPDLVLQINNLDESITRILNTKSMDAEILTFPQLNVPDLLTGSVNPGPG